MAIPISKQVCSVLRKTILRREVPLGLGSLGNFVPGQARNSSSYRAAVLKELKKPLVIESVNAPKKIKKDEVSCSLYFIGFAAAVQIINVYLSICFFLFSYE